jgi:hypothetical protein
MHMSNRIESVRQLSQKIVLAGLATGVTFAAAPPAFAGSCPSDQMKSAISMRR